MNLYELTRNERNELNEMNEINELNEGELELGSEREQTERVSF